MADAQEARAVAQRAPLAGEDAAALRAMTAVFLRELLRSRGHPMRAPTVSERAAERWLDDVEAEVLGEQSKPRN